MKITVFEYINEACAKDKLIRRRGLTYVEGVCKHCGAKFKRRKGLTMVFCSRKCNGLHNLATKPISDEMKAKILELRKQGLSVYKIHDQLGVARNTIMKYWA